MIIIACIVKTVKKLWVSSCFFAKSQTILGDFMLHFKKYGVFTKIHLCISGFLMCFQISHGHQWFSSCGLLIPFVILILWYILPGNMCVIWFHLIFYANPSVLRLLKLYENFRLSRHYRCNVYATKMLTARVNFGPFWDNMRFLTDYGHGISCVLNWY